MDAYDSPGHCVGLHLSYRNGSWPQSKSLARSDAGPHAYSFLPLTPIVGLHCYLLHTGHRFRFGIRWNLPRTCPRRPSVSSFNARVHWFMDSSAHACAIGSRHLSQASHTPRNSSTVCCACARHPRTHMAYSWLGTRLVWCYRFKGSMRAEWCWSMCCTLHYGRLWIYILSLNMLRCYI